MELIRYARLLAKYLWPHRARFSLLALLLFSSIGLQLYVPQIVRQFIDQATAGATLETLTQLALWFLGLAVLNQVFSAGSTYLAADVGWAATNRLRSDLFRHVLNLDMAFHKDRTPGELIERIDGDVTSISNFFSQFVVRVSGALLLMLGILGVLWLEDPRVGLLLTVFVGVAFAVLHRRREVAVPATRDEREASAQVYGFIEERLAGLDDLRANGAGPYTMHRFLQVQRDWYAKSLKAWWLRSTIWLSMGILFGIGIVMVLGMGAWLYLGGAITLGTAYLFLNYITLLENPLDQITQQLQEFQRAAAGIKRVDELLAEQRSIADGTQTLSVHKAHSIEFRKVRFRYAAQDVLQNLSFRLEAGQTLGLLGRTGSGKSTLIRLLFRLYDPSEGAVLLDGQDTQHIQVARLRQRVGLVTQDVQLFHGTVRQNLSFFDPGVPDEQMVQVLQNLGLGDWLAGLPQGLDTVLQSGGSGLSAGESQLLAFARVFLQDPGLVILDEPSSRLDPATERLLGKAIAELLKGRTGIVIAHRLETVQHLDQIMVLSQGQILEYGARAVLQANPGSTYSQMLRLANEADLDLQMQRMGL